MFYSYLMSIALRRIFIIKNYFLKMWEKTKQLNFIKKTVRWRLLNKTTQMQERKKCVFLFSSLLLCFCNWKEIGLWVIKVLLLQKWFTKKSSVFPYKETFDKLNSTHELVVTINTFKWAFSIEPIWESGKIHFFYNNTRANVNTIINNISNILIKFIL